MELIVFYSQHTFTLDDSLNDDEIKRCHFFRYERERCRFTFAHRFKRNILSEVCPDVLPIEWSFYTSENGKPYVKKPLSFNLSHSHDAVAMVVLKKQSNMNIGIDIECYQKIEYTDTLSRLIFHPEELNTLNHIADKNKGFYLLWTAKEALLKANGSGLVDNLNEVNCSQCLTRNRSLVVWQKKYYWIDTKCLGWGVCSVAWCDSLNIDSLIHVNKFTI